MDFVAIIGFIITYYIRPQEWMPGLGSLRPVLVIFVFAIIAMIFRKRGFRPKELLQTPHDWLMLGFFAWIIISSGAQASSWFNLPSVLRLFLTTLWDTKNLIGFYFVIVQALHTRGRLERFLWWWLGMILLVAVLALAGEYGFDLMNSYEITHGHRMRGRLVLNSEIFNNPNALGHSVVPLIPLIYLLCVWQRPLFLKQAALALMAIPLWCVYLTQSKGGYFSGGIAAVTALIFGRPKFVQAVMLTLALTIGVSLIVSLPRMETIGRPRREPGIQGRIMAFSFGRDAFLRNRLLGFENFKSSFKNMYGYKKSAHSSYVQIGAETGPLGLWLYLGVLYCCLKTLFTARTRTLADERLRRVLFAALIAFMASSWMIDFAYHGTFFVLVACVAAFHRHLRSSRLEEAEAAPAQAFAPPAETQKAQPATETEESRDGARSHLEKKDGHENSDKEQEPAGIPAISWNRLTWFDLALILGMLLVTVRLWSFLVYWE